MAIYVFRLSFILIEREMDMVLIRRLLNEEDGQDIMEYVIIAAMVSIVAIALVKFTGGKLNGLWSGLNDTMW